MIYFNQHVLPLGWPLLSLLLMAMKMVTAKANQEMAMQDMLVETDPSTYFGSFRHISIEFSAP